MVHLTTRSAWAQAQQVGHSSHPSLLTDGYIHCSTPTEEQVIAVANAYFVGQSDFLPAPDGLFSLSSIVSLSSLTASSPTL
jgi:uncharacterized protein (DUF952 family)